MSISRCEQLDPRKSFSIRLHSSGSTSAAATSSGCSIHYRNTAAHLLVALGHAGQTSKCQSKQPLRKPVQQMTLSSHNSKQVRRVYRSAWFSVWMDPRCVLCGLWNVFQRDSHNPRNHNSPQAPSPASRRIRQSFPPCVQRPSHEK